MTHPFTYLKPCETKTDSMSLPVGPNLQIVGTTEVRKREYARMVLLASRDGFVLHEIAECAYPKA